MFRVVLLFVIGIWCFYQMPILPGWSILALETAALVVMVFPRRLRGVLYLGIGFVWAHAHALVTQPPLIAGPEGGRKLSVRGEVVSLVQRKAGLSRFILRASEVRDAASAQHGRWRLRLTWRDAPEIRPGDRLHLSVRIRHAHGFASPGAWDYEGWLHRQGVRYTGYVRERLGDDTPAGHCCAVDRLRDAMSADIDRLAMSPFARGVVRAIAIGDKSGLAASARDLFRDTGTSHLMAISGLHIGLVAGIGLVGFTRFWRLFPSLAEHVPARVAGALFGMAMGGAYAILAGMSLPTQRALIMLSLLAWGMLGRIRGSPANVLIVAAGGVSIWNPASVIDAGFWLSFGAVGAILAAAARSDPTRRWLVAIRLQLAVNIALWPLLFAFGLPVAAAAPLANLILVPLFGLFVVPVALLGVSAQAFVPQAGDWLLINLGVVLDIVEQGLMWLQALSWPLWHPGEQRWESVTLGIAAVLLLLAPRGFPLRALAIPVTTIACMPVQQQLEKGAFNLHVLDVGQGLSAVIETRDHTLVFDTGPAFPSGFSTAAAVVKPFLDHRRRRVVDRLILSHSDNDHAGGAASLVANVEVHSIQSGEPHEHALHASRCSAGQRWRWDGVAFEYLHPSGDQVAHGNNASCVLRVTGSGGSILLTGDIESTVEHRLIDLSSDRLRSDIVVVPHHGSATSSSAAFVEATGPEYVIYSAGWSNRYGFPVHRVDSRWRAAGALRLNTADAGTVSFRVTPDDGISPPVCHRISQRRFWWHVGGSADACHAVSSADQNKGVD